MPRTAWSSAACLLAAALAVGPAGDAAAQGAPTTLFVASFGGKIDEVFREIFKPFEEQHKLSIRWTPAASAENAAKAVAIKGTPEFDIILTDSLNLPNASRQGAFRKIDPAKVPNYADLFDDAKMKTGDGAALGFYYSGLFYNQAEFAKRGWAPPTSWADVFRPEFCNVLALPHPIQTYGIDIPLVMAGGDIAKLSESIKEYGKLKSCIAVLEPSASKVEEKIQLGEYIVGNYISMRVVGLALAGQPLKFVIPKEGTLSAAGVVTLPVGSKSPAMAEAFMDWMLSPQAQKVIAEKIGYSPANRKVQVGSEMLAAGVPTGDVLAKTKQIDREPAFRDKRRWIREIEVAFSK